MTRIKKLFPDLKSQEGSLSTLLHYLSKFYILPLNINYQKGKLSYGFYSFKTLMHSLVVSIPFALSLTWIFLQPSHYLKDCWNAITTVFDNLDLTVMFFFPCLPAVPIQSFMLTTIVSKSWVANPALTFYKQLQFPNNIKRISYLFLLMTVSYFLIFWAFFWANSSLLTQYSWQRNFVTLFLSLFIPVMYNTFTWFIFAIMCFSMMDQIHGQLKHAPKSVEETWMWARESVNLFRDFVETFHLNIFTFISMR